MRNVMARGQGAVLFASPIAYVIIGLSRCCSAGSSTLPHVFVRQSER